MPTAYFSPNTKSQRYNNMPKPKPLPPAVLALQKAEADLPSLRERLKRLVTDGDDEQEKDELAPSSEGDGSAEDDKGQESSAKDGDAVSEGPEDEDADQEDPDQEDSDDDLEELYQYDHPLPNNYQIEIEGVCVVTEDLIHETLTTYNEEAIKWIKDHLHLITQEDREAADIVYPWVQTTLASHHHGVFELDGDRLFSRRHHSFPKSLLEGDLFKTLHALLFSAHPVLAQCYVDAAEGLSRPNYIPPASIEDCLGPVEACPGIYGYNTHAEAVQKLYIGRSQNIKKRLADHHSPTVVGVNRIVRAAKATTKTTDWTSGALVTFKGEGIDGDYGHVPQGIWSAIETSLIACHGSTAIGPGQAQINIVDRCMLPRPRLKEDVLQSLYVDVKRGKPLDEISKEFNIASGYIQKLVSGRCSYKTFSRDGKHERLHDWLVMQRLRMENPYEQQPLTGDHRGRVPPLYPRLKSLEFGYVGRDFKQKDATENKTPSRTLDQKLYPLRTRGVSEIWELRDYANGITALPPLAPLVFPMDEYRQQAMKMYADAFTAGIPANVWKIATTNP